MIINKAESIPSKNETERVVIIGGGTVGLYLGVLLARQKQEVLIIESGDHTLDNFQQESYQCVGLPHEGIRIGRSRSLGGTSNLWGGQLVEYQAVDLAGRDWLTDSRWPISFEEISGYFPTTYENLGIPKALQTDEAVFRGLQTTVPKFSGEVELFLTRWMKIPSTAALFRDELEKNPHITVLLDHTVNEMQGVGGTVSAVSALGKDGRSHRIKGGRFVLAAGTFEIVRLMLHAAQSSDWDCPWQDNQNLGCFFQDHIGGRAASVHPIDRKRFMQLFSTIIRSGFKFQPKLRMTSASIAQEQILNIQGMLHFESSVSENLVFLKQFLKATLSGGKVSNLRDLPRHAIACLRYLPPLMFRYALQNRVFVPSGSKISFTLQSEQTPIYESRIKVDPGIYDQNGLPKLSLDWKIGEHELRSMRDFTLRCKEALESAGIAELRIVPELASLNPSFLTKVRDNYHQVGGVRMGTTAQDGVVDSDLRVFGTTNLYALGASTFRTTSNANTTFLALAFATRMADRLHSK